MKTVDYSIYFGKKYGRYTVLEIPYLLLKGKRRDRYAKCECECGVVKTIRFDGLRSGHIVSCGCYNRQISSEQKTRLTHGMAYTPEYKIWKKIKDRCYNEKCKAYPNYGGRGIKMDDAWRNSFESFYAHMGKRPSPELSVDRYPNNDTGNYEPGNVRWGTDEEQANNKRNNIKYLHNGKMLTLPQIARLEKIGFPTLYRRINENNLTLQEALAVPLHGKCGKEAYGLKGFTKEEIIQAFLSNDPVPVIAVNLKMSKCQIYKIKMKKTHKRIIEDYLNDQKE